MRVGDEIINEEGLVAHVHIVLGDEVVAKDKENKLFTFKLGDGAWIVYKSKLLQYKSEIDGLTIEELQDKLLELRKNKSIAKISNTRGTRSQSAPAMSKEDKGILSLIKQLDPMKIKALKEKLGIT